MTVAIDPTQHVKKWRADPKFQLGQRVKILDTTVTHQIGKIGLIEEIGREGNQFKVQPEDGSFFLWCRHGQLKLVSNSDLASTELATAATPLDSLINEINSLHGEAEQAAATAKSALETAIASTKSALESAKLCGEKLLAAKQEAIATLGWGKWEAVRDDRVKIPSSTASLYQGIAQFWEELESRDVTSLKQAQALLPRLRQQRRIKDCPDSTTVGETQPASCLSCQHREPNGEVYRCRAKSPVWECEVSADWAVDRNDGRCDRFKASGYPASPSPLQELDGFHLGQRFRNHPHVGELVAIDPEKGFSIAWENWRTIWYSDAAQIKDWAQSQVVRFRHNDQILEGSLVSETDDGAWVQFEDRVLPIHRDRLVVGPDVDHVGPEVDIQWGAGIERGTIVSRGETTSKVLIGSREIPISNDQILAPSPAIYNELVQATQARVAGFQQQQRENVGEVAIAQLGAKAMALMALSRCREAELSEISSWIIDRS